jgi:hypothetical protein
VENVGENPPPQGASGFKCSEARRSYARMRVFGRVGGSKATLISRPGAAEA